jgi:hypothetical protein
VVVCGSREWRRRRVRYEPSEVTCQGRFLSPDYVSAKEFNVVCIVMGLACSAACTAPAAVYTFVTVLLLFLHIHATDVRGCGLMVNGTNGQYNAPRFNGCVMCR